MRRPNATFYFKLHFSTLLLISSLVVFYWHFMVFVASSKFSDKSIQNGLRALGLWPWTQSRRTAKRRRTQPQPWRFWPRTFTWSFAWVGGLNAAQRSRSAHSCTRRLAAGRRSLSFASAFLPNVEHWCSHRRRHYLHQPRVQNRRPHLYVYVLDHHVGDDVHGCARSGLVHHGRKTARARLWTSQTRNLGRRRAQNPRHAHLGADTAAMDPHRPRRYQ